MGNKQFTAIIMDNGELISINKANVDNQKQPNSNMLKEDDFGELYTTGKVAKPPYNPKHLASFLESNTYHYRCVKQKAADTVGLGYDLEEEEEGDGDKIKNKQYKEITQFFKKCNPNMTFNEIVEQAWIDYESIGWLVIEVIRQKGQDKKVARLEHIPAATCRVSLDSNLPGIIQRVGRKERFFKYFGETEEIIDPNTNAPASEVIFMVNYHPKTDFYGLPDFIPSIGAIVASMEIRDYNIEFFDNNAIPDYAVILEGGEPDESFEKTVKDYFKNNLKGKGKAHKTIVLAAPEGGKIRFEPLSVDIKDGHFRMYRLDSRDEIIHAHGVPPYRIGIAETGSLGGSTAQEANKIYKSSIVQPRQEKIENRITSLIKYGLGIEGWNFKYNEIDLTDKKLEADIEKTKAETAKTLVEAGLSTPDEARYNILDMEKYNDNKEIDDDVKEWAKRPITVPKQPEGMPQDQQQAINQPTDPEFDAAFNQQFEADMKAQGLDIKKILGYIPQADQSILKKVIGIFKKKSKSDFFKRQDELYEKMKGSLTNYFNDMSGNMVDLVGKIDLNKYIKSNENNAEIKKGLSGEDADAMIAMYPELYAELSEIMSDTEFATLLYVLMQEGIEIGKLSAIDDLAQFAESIDWNLYDERTSEFLDNYVFKASKKTIDRLIGDVLLQIKLGQELGESIPQIQKRLDQMFTDMNDYETERIARTETNKSSNWARFQAFRDSGKPYKVWKTNVDGRERDSHRRTNLVCIPMEDKFANGLFYPGDPSSDKVSEIVNCRCTLMWADNPDGTMNI